MIFAYLSETSKTGFSLTPYLESFTPTFGLGTPVFPRISSNLHCGTPTFSKRCLWDSYFQNPSENPVKIRKKWLLSLGIVNLNLCTITFKTPVS